MTTKFKEKRNTIIITDIPTILYNTVKKTAKENERTLGKEALVALKEKFK